MSCLLRRSLLANATRFTLAAMIVALIAGGCERSGMENSPPEEVRTVQLIAAVLDLLRETHHLPGDVGLVHPGVVRSDDGVPAPYDRGEFYSPAPYDAIRTAVDDADAYEVCGEAGEPPCRPGENQFALIFAPVQWERGGRATVWVTILDGFSALTFQADASPRSGGWRIDGLELRYAAP
jgi:hypothetical protein